MELLLFAVTCHSAAFLSCLWGQVGTMFCLHWCGKETIGTTCCEWIAAHIHGSFVDQADKDGAHSMTRSETREWRTETAALRPKDSAESNEGQLKLRILPKLTERRRKQEKERRNNNLGEQISCHTIVADTVEFGKKRHIWQGTNFKVALIAGAEI